MISLKRTNWEKLDPLISVPFALTMATTAFVLVELIAVKIILQGAQLPRHSQVGDFLAFLGALIAFCSLIAFATFFAWIFQFYSGEKESKSKKAFNGTHVPIHVAEAIDEFAAYYGSEVTVKGPAWLEPIGNLVGVDNPAALSELGSELERELRHYTMNVRDEFNQETLESIRNPTDFVHTLASRKLLSPDISIPLENVLAVCDASIHGAQVSDRLAVSTVSVGQHLLGLLHARPTSMAPASPVPTEQNI